MAQGHRLQTWKVRRTIESGTHQEFEFLRSWDRNAGATYWEPLYMDGYVFTNEDHAEDLRGFARSVNRRTDVIYHAVVDD